MRAIVVAVGVLAGAACAESAERFAGLPIAEPETLGMSAERLARIGPAMQRYIDDDRVPGTVTAVAREGRVVHLEARGLRDVAAEAPMTPETVFRIASMTKPITSVALMMLWEAGRLQLDDAVADYLPAFADMKVSTTADASGETGELVPAESPITVRQLLTHTAGFANSYVGNTEAYERLADPDDYATLEAWIPRLAALPLNYQPGTDWQYSHATDVVGRLVEKVSGQDLDVFFRERIFEPLGMRDTHFFLDPEDPETPRLAAQYTPGEDGTIELDDPAGAQSRWVTAPETMLRGAGGLVSTIGDYLRFQQMMLQGGRLGDVRLLGPKTVSLMLENHTGELELWLPGPGHGFGLGYAVVTDRGEAATPLSRGSAYWGGAYCTFSWIDRREALVAVLMTQVRPYTHLDIRAEFQNLVSAAVIE